MAAIPELPFVAVPPERPILTRVRAGKLSRPPAPRSDAPPAPHAGAWSKVLGGVLLGTSQIDALNRLAEVRQLPSGHMVYQRHEVAQDVWWISQGDVALGTQTAEGGFRIEQHRQGPAWLDVSAAWQGQRHALDARALTASTVVTLPCAPLRELLLGMPAIALAFVDALAQEVQGLAATTQVLVHQDAPARLAQWLLSHCEVEGLEGSQRGHIALPMRKRDIASQLAITPETLSRLMRSLSDQGVIRVEGYIVQVLDLPALRRKAG